MKLHSTLSRRIEELRPLQAKQVRIYSCGPTLYDRAHIGNLSSFIMADTLRRVLATAGYEVTHVMNFTDVDDKTIRRSHEQYPDLEPMAALHKLTEEHRQHFLDDMQAVGNDIEKLTFVKATDSIVQMQTLITTLYESGFAYVADDGVYFSIESYQKSGKKYGQLTEITAASTSEARIQNDEYDKQSVHDFALWKTQKPGEPAWEFELNGQDLRGRPGWHIECSAMSTAALGQPFDIHTGGVDLIFPHHENEIAQSTAGKDNAVYAQCFVHSEHLLVDGQKMAKSANNFYTLQDIIGKGFDPLAFRLLVLQAHYRSQAHFSWENLEAAQNRLKGLQVFADLRFQPIGSPAHETPPLEHYQQTIKEALADDLNTPQALFLLNELTDTYSSITTAEKTEFETFLLFLDEALGIGLLASADIEPSQKNLIAEREKARQGQDWAKSDELREQLKEQGIGLRDTPAGPIWFRE